MAIGLLKVACLSIIITCIVVVVVVVPEFSVHSKFPSIYQWVIQFDEVLAYWGTRMLVTIIYSFFGVYKKTTIQTHNQENIEATWQHTGYIVQKFPELNHIGIFKSSKNLNHMDMPAHMIIIKFSHINEIMIQQMTH
ncbi:hypothetical protein ACJX0J_005442 [Zea mays]